jgi:ParB family chromosome partitioning protein
VAAKRRGLGSLIPGAEYDEAGVDTRAVPIDLIAASAYQPRQQRDEERLAELVDSVRTHGLLQPVVVREVDGGYQLVAGGRRLEAARRAGLSEVPAVLRECTDAESLELALVENLQREDLNPLDSAQAYRRLIDDFHLSQDDVARRVGRSRSAVSNSLRLLNLPSVIQQSLMAGRISEGHGRALLMVDDIERALDLWRRGLDLDLLSPPDGHQAHGAGELVNAAVLHVLAQAQTVQRQRAVPHLYRAVLGQRPRLTVIRRLDQPLHPIHRRLYLLSCGSRACRTTRPSMTSLPQAREPSSMAISRSTQLKGEAWSLSGEPSGSEA